MKPAVTFPRVETLCIDVLAELATYEPTVTVGAQLPASWTPSSAPFVTVHSDGAPNVQYPVVEWPTVRLVGWASSPTVADRIVHAAQGVLVANAPFKVEPLTGALPARDPDHGNAYLASLTCRVTVRSTPLVPA